MRYCDKRCREEYHNIRKSEQRELKDRIENEHTKTHWWNRDILKHYAGQDVPLTTLKERGFKPNFITALSSRKIDKKTYLVYVVFDHHFLRFPQKDGSIIIRVGREKRADAYIAEEEDW